MVDGGLETIGGFLEIFGGPQNLWCWVSNLLVVFELEVSNRIDRWWLGRLSQRGVGSRIGGVWLVVSYRWWSRICICGQIDRGEELSGWMDGWAGGWRQWRLFSKM